MTLCSYKKIFAEEGKGQFSTRINVLGHAQQGGNPTPFDRNMGTKFGARALVQLLDQARVLGHQNATTPNTATLIGIEDRHITFTPVEELAEITNFEQRLPREQWWLKLRPIMRILAKHQGVYRGEAMDSEIHRATGVDEES